MQEVAPRQDGRLARSARTRRAIVDAMRSLHHAGDLRPTAPRVADRAGVSLRTVFQHFEDLEALLIEAGRRDYEIAMRYVRPVPLHAPLLDRIRAVVDQRGEMYDALAPVWRAARLQEPFSPQIRSNRDRLMAAGRAQLELVFGSELDRMPASRRESALHAAQVATSWATWESLRTELHLAPDAAGAAVRTLLEPLLSTR
ncbi:MAG: TetR/AcrR family transcriptional regulator, regulator of autoinduction and epiphytic fitness [Frankiaceae bacterium]|nr:TetR/AcrR family transcriptional regulator, regulator of autoinduction and epiphytic fitness [Frankiaceae bacterium]